MEQYVQLMLHTEKTTTFPVTYDDDTNAFHWYLGDLILLIGALATILRQVQLVHDVATEKYC